MAARVALGVTVIGLADSKLVKKRSPRGVPRTRPRTFASQSVVVPFRNYPWKDPTSVPSSLVT